MLTSILSIIHSILLSLYRPVHKNILSLLCFTFPIHFYPKNKLTVDQTADVSAGTFAIYPLVALTLALTAVIVDHH